MRFRNIILAVFFLPTIVLAHGEDQPGPHGGSIRMPGAFHTEVIINKDKSVQVYLLDMNFKNPTIKDSKVTVRIENKKKINSLKCAAMGDHFHCHSEDKQPLKGRLVVEATREKAVGNEAVYELPLKYTPQKQKKSEGHHHH